MNTYSWTGAPAAPGTKNVTATNNATAWPRRNAPFTLTADNTAPTAGTVTYADTTQTSTSVSVGFTTGTDGGSGLGTRLLQRPSATADRQHLRHLRRVRHRHRRHQPAPRRSPTP